MLSLAALVLLAAAPAEAASAPPRGSGITVSAMATAEVLRPGTATTAQGEGDLRRQFRPREGGRSTVEFE